MDYFCFFVLGLFIKTGTTQFPKHVDLQKVGQITFQGETYNVLKSTVHEVTDHFKDFMLRRDTRPDERLFIDDDGFRHRWNGFGIPTNLRKSHKHHKNVDRKNKINDDLGLFREERGLPEDAFVYFRRGRPLRQAKAAAATAKAVATTKKPAAAKAGATTKKLAAATTKAGAATKKPAAATTKAGATTKKPAAATTKAGAATTKAGATTKKPAAATTKAGAVATTKAGAATQKPAAATTKAGAATQKPAAATSKAGAAAKSPEVGRTRTAAKTYFFCPFFGVISMRGFID